MRISEQQLNQFNTFGFLVFHNLLSPAEVDLYRQEMDAGLDARIEGGNHDGTKRFWAYLNDSDTPFITSLSDDPRFGDVAEQLLGKDVIAICGDSNYYVGDTQWHPDVTEFDAVKFTIYLESLDANTGALRVIPGSHREPYHSQIARDTETAFGVRPEDLPAYAFASNPGDVLVFNVATWHSAFGGSTRRRMSTLQYYEDPQTPEITERVGRVLRASAESYMSRLNRPMYPSYWRSIDNPRHQRWVGRLAELGVLEHRGPRLRGAGHLPK